jgi:hypothetical protein
MDHLGHHRFHVMGGCIGGTYCLTLCELAPERVTPRCSRIPSACTRTGHMGSSGERLRQDHAGP